MLEPLEMVESLEARRLCSSAVRHNRPVFNVDGDTLRVSGSFRDDAIVFSGHASRITVNLNGKANVIRRPISYVVVYGGAGDDSIENTGSFAVYMDGGTGKDRLQSGYGADTLLGGTGDDVLIAQQYLGQPVYMDAGPGNDRLTFGTTMYGGSGYDVGTVDNGSASLTISGGLEQYKDPYSGYDFSPYPNLSSHKGELVFAYQADGEYDQSISGPFVRADGRVVLAVDNTYPDPASPAPPAGVWRVTLDDHFTALAKRRGLVLTVGDPASGYTIEERVVLIPAK